MMLSLQAQDCHNINLVSPSHVVAQIIAAVQLAAQQGLHLPLVYNTGGYDSLEALALLDGIIDTYMPDMKYGDSALARTYSRVRNYVEVNFAAVREMHRQVGDLQLDEQGFRPTRHVGAPPGPARRAGRHRQSARLPRAGDIDEYLSQPYGPVSPMLPRR